jgi:hypothetical protein
VLFLEFVITSDLTRMGVHLAIPPSKLVANPIVVFSRPSVVDTQGRKELTVVVTRLSFLNLPLLQSLFLGGRLLQKLGFPTARRRMVLGDDLGLEEAVICH